MKVTENFFANYCVKSIAHISGSTTWKCTYINPFRHKNNNKWEPKCDSLIVTAAVKTLLAFLLGLFSLKVL